jgi:O-antigen/teichoic acid export membrane protein
MSNSKQKSITKNSIYYSIYQVLNVIFPFFTGMYVARILLPDAVGKVAYAQNIAQYFVILAFLGLPTYGMREIAKVRNNESERSKVYSQVHICV